LLYCLLQKVTRTTTILQFSNFQVNVNIVTMNFKGSFLPLLEYTGGPQKISSYGVINELD